MQFTEYIKQDFFEKGDINEKKPQNKTVTCTKKTPKNQPNIKSNQNTIVRAEHIYLAVFEGILLQPL